MDHKELHTAHQNSKRFHNKIYPRSYNEVLYNQIVSILRRSSGFQSSAKIHHRGISGPSVRLSRQITKPIGNQMLAMPSWRSLRKHKVEPPGCLLTACQIATSPYSQLIKNNWRQVLRALFHQCVRIKL